MSRRRYPKHFRAVLDHARRVAGPVGAHVGIDPTGRHPVITIALGGTVRTVRFPCSPRCVDLSVKLARRDVQRAIKELGAEG